MAVHLDEPAAPMTISSEEREFFVNLGERIATLRRASNITQVNVEDTASRARRYLA